MRPDRPEGHGAAWEVLCANHDQIEKWVKNGLTVVKIGDLLARQPMLHCVVEDTAKDAQRVTRSRRRRLIPLDQVGGYLSRDRYG